MPSPARAHTPDGPVDLAAWQRAVQASVLGVRADAAPLRPAAELVRNGRGLSAEESLAVYRRMIRRRLETALASDFPATRAALGERDFTVAVERHVVARHLIAVPPSSFTLAHLGRGFAAVVAAQGAWIAELACIEWARHEIADTPSPRTSTKVVLGDRTVEQWQRARFEAALPLRVCHLDYDVEATRRRLLAGEPATPEFEANVLVVYRTARGVAALTMRPDEGALFAALAGGIALAEALEAALATSPASDLARFHDWLRRWFAAGLLTVAATTTDPSRRKV